MTSPEFLPLFIIFIIAWMVPLLLSWLEIGKIPAVIAEIIMGVIAGLVLGGLLIGFDQLFKRFNLRSFNIAVIGMIAIDWNTFPAHLIDELSRFYNIPGKALSLFYSLFGSSRYVYYCTRLTQHFGNSFSNTT